jgi:hypothetical protein
MMKINYDSKIFTSGEKSKTGEVSAETFFHYHQKDNLIWAEYAGGAIVFGNLIGKITDNEILEIRYQHLNQNGELMTGQCFSTPETLSDGRIRLREKWQWTSGDFSSGESIVEETSS